MEFVCHCSIRMYDEGLEANTRTNPTITVEAESKEEARHEAKRKVAKQYNHPKTEIKKITVDLINKI